MHGVVGVEKVFESVIAHYALNYDTCYFVQIYAKKIEKVKENSGNLLGEGYLLT